MKKHLNRFVWLAVPTLLVVGCAESQRAPSVSYSPALSEQATPTSDRSQTRVYSEPSAGADATAPPPGAASQDWVLAQEIRSLLMSDPKLGNAPMTAVAKDGVVTLRGSVRNQKDRDRLRDEISKLPGVQRVDDQLEFKNPLDKGAGESKSF
jgi:osmotically-inducible protein OsmY